LVENNNKLINKLKIYINELPKNSYSYVLPVIRKTSKYKSEVHCNSYSLMFPIKILHESPMDYNKLANILIAEIISK
jgi:hypothetical protein